MDKIQMSMDFTCANSWPMLLYGYYKRNYNYVYEIIVKYKKYNLKKKFKVINYYATKTIICTTIFYTKLS